MYTNIFTHDCRDSIVFFVQSLQTVRENWKKKRKKTPFAKWMTKELAKSPN